MLHASAHRQREKSKGQKTHLKRVDFSKFPREGQDKSLSLPLSLRRLGPSGLIAVVTTFQNLAPPLFSSPLYAPDNNHKGISSYGYRYICTWLQADYFSRE